MLFKLWALSLQLKKIVWTVTRASAWVLEDHMKLLVRSLLESIADHQRLLHWMQGSSWELRPPTQMDVELWLPLNARWTLQNLSLMIPLGKKIKQLTLQVCYHLLADWTPRLFPWLSVQLDVCLCSRDSHRRNPAHAGQLCRGDQKISKYQSYANYAFSISFHIFSLSFIIIFHFASFACTTSVTRLNQGPNASLNVSCESLCLALSAKKKHLPCGHSFRQRAADLRCLECSQRRPGLRGLAYHHLRKGILRIKQGWGTKTAKQLRIWITLCDLSA